jgi:hypothetical protein
MILKTTTRTKLEHSARALKTEFDAVPYAVIAADVEATARSLLERARFDDYVPILTHRYVRDRLRRAAAASTLADAA